MQIINVPIDDIKPYGGNAKRHPRRQIDALANSIKQFGFDQNLVVDEDLVIVKGHGRWMAAKQAGLTVLPCMICTGLTEQQKNANRLADNQVSKGEWDMDLLKAELSGLSFDMSVFNFDLDDIFKEKPDDYKQSKNLDNFFRADFDMPANEWGIPEVKPFTGDLSTIKWVSFGEKAGIKRPGDTGIHFYIDDYKFDSVWRSPDKWLDLFRSCRAVVTPDFSNYTDMPKAQQLWNHYRRQWLGAYWQERGINVVSSLSWANGQIFDWSFSGVPHGTTCATSFVGDAIDKQAGIEELQAVIEIVRPYKLYVKASRKDQEILAKHFDCEFIQPYQFKG